MTNAVRAIRGMHDVLPAASPLWQTVEAAFVAAAHAYHYQEIRFPIVEYQQLFARSIGDVTDIVEKEMYTFTDRNADGLALRPEGTAGCVRAAIQHGLLYKQTQRLWYLGPMFRYERPQLGRSRQFHQFGIEALGIDDALADAEVLALSARVWRHLGLTPAVTLHINSLGSLASRQHYRQQLVDYFTRHRSALDADSQRRLQTNPLRILDSKNPDMQALIEDAPQLRSHLADEDAEHFENVLAHCAALDIPYTINPRLVRGLDYYNRTVFEWVTDTLGAQGTVCAGGRYDGLVSMLGGKPTPAVGFAAGIERIVEMLKQQASTAQHQNRVDVYMVSQSLPGRERALLLAEACRRQAPRLRVCCHLGEGGFKSQFKQADASGARFAVIIAEQELATETVSIKFLRQTREQIQLPMAELADFLIQETAGSDHAHI